MLTTLPQEIRVYQAKNGREPFNDWLDTIRDLRTQDRIQSRLARLEDGNFGDCQSIGNGVYELRLHFGAGYRVYFGRIDKTFLLLLCGGDKTSQKRDIERAKTFWLEYKRENL